MQSLLPQPDRVDQLIIDVARQLFRDRFACRVDRQAVREINRSHGTDVATALLYLHFYHQLDNDLSDRPLAEPTPWMIAIVPGAFYQQHPEIGGDGRQIAELAAQNGWCCEMIPTESLGTLESNAQSIIRFLDEHSEKYRILPISLSKGTTDLIAAIHREPRVLENLLGWISISGVPRGTMMADWLLDRWRLRPILNLMCWKHGADRQAVADLRYKPQKTFSEFRRIPTIHIAGFPLKRHLSNWRSRLWHRRFRPSGPNDSVVLLEDYLNVDGTVIPVWGADHYLKSGWNVPMAIESLVSRLSCANANNVPRPAQPRPAQPILR